jgi:hypothetical protein
MHVQEEFVKYETEWQGHILTTGNISKFNISNKHSQLELMSKSEKNPTLQTRLLIFSSQELCIINLYISWAW